MPDAQGVGRGVWNYLWLGTLPAGLDTHRIATPPCQAGAVTLSERGRASLGYSLCQRHAHPHQAVSGLCQDTHPKHPL